MATRTLKVEFVPEDVLGETDPEPQVHDVSIPDSVIGVPGTLENPHTDFPGVWTLVGDGADGAHRYARAARVAGSSDTAAG